MINVYAERQIKKAEELKMASISYKVYANENGKAVYIGDASGPDYETVKAFVISEGLNEKDFMLIKKND